MIKGYFTVLLSNLSHQRDRTAPYYTIMYVTVFKKKYYRYIVRYIYRYFLRRYKDRYTNRNIKL